MGEERPSLEAMCFYNRDGLCFLPAVQKYNEDGSPDGAARPPCRLCFAWRTDDAATLETYRVGERDHVTIYDVLAVRRDLWASMPGGTRELGGGEGGVQPTPPRMGLSPDPATPEARKKLEEW